MHSSSPVPDLHEQFSRSSGNRPQLLVSVRDASEARLARSLGVDWIDLKDPDAGPLGAPQQPTAEFVAAELHDFPSRSAAAGELHRTAMDSLVYLAPLFPIVKVGLSQQACSPTWRTQLADLSQQAAANGAQIVPVVYADYQACDAPAPSQIVEAAAVLRAPFVLIDTFHKAGRGLLSWLQLSELEEIVRIASQNGRGVVVAGSLSEDDVPAILQLAVAAIAVRGAVCNTDRRSALCPYKITQWVELFKNP